MDIVPLDVKLPQKNPKKDVIYHKSKISREDAEIIDSLNKVAYELSLAHKSFEMANSDILIDSFIFEIMSLNKRYDYYIRLCKERGLIAEGMKS